MKTVYAPGYIKRGIKEPSYEIKPEWPILAEIIKQHQDKLPNITPGDVGTAIEAGQIHEFNMKWDKCRVQKYKKIPALEKTWEETSIIDDEYI